MRKPGIKNLTPTQKLQIESLRKENKNAKWISKQLGLHYSTVYRELNKGTINGQYSAKYSNQISTTLNKNKGTKSKFEIDRDFASQVSKMILEENLSIIQIKKRCEELNIDCPSRQTIYRAIDENLIPNVTRESLNSNVTTIFSKGLIQIPKHIREKLNLNDKDKVNINLNENKIIITKIYNS